ncbi:FMN-dependent NADH-azoreductase [Antarcticimicrobium luteum]|uniref:FMN dependent NADH:quinone oxidoreductase n=1 Tax=Antarcticimicrobium luteum TaxID=2547397 RepID=A0A4R5V5M1_9RHOB|nr:NAD(P)H-dependent oxidoreductase [Antarcticimicrobium luteum]TDK46776.1 FMN-dependent NADH-azoreductase [Antarcticimicrobium luteum]
MTHTVLHIDTSARRSASTSRDLSAKIVDRLAAGTVLRRDLADALPLIDETWIAANFTPEDQRNDAQRAQMALSDDLVDELKAADVLVIGLPIYNFSVPATLKAWIDMVARVGVTFRYTEAGPEGLLKGKRAILAVTSGGTPVGSEIDFATGYLRHVLGFIGITDIEIVAADRMNVDPDAALRAANEALDNIAA